ncbi:MAG: response regulator [Flavitalea sp.]
MAKSGPILVIEDDEDDQEILTEVFKELAYENEVIFFADGYKALEYLNAPTIRPFLIISDINMPKLTGFELRDIVQNNEDLRMRCIPFLFFTTSASPKDVIRAYSKSSQGFFVKQDDHEQIRDTMRRIIDYWKDCIYPNKVM